MDQQAVEGFIERYRTTFETLDAAAITAMFTFPCQVVGDAGAVAVASVPTAELWGASIERIVAAYRMIGVATADLGSLQVVVLTPGSAHAIVRWNLRTADGEPVYSFTASYTVVDTAGGPRIAVVVHDETLLLQQAVAAAAARRPA
jgi:hypothetical protein